MQTPFTKEFQITMNFKASTTKDFLINKINKFKKEIQELEHQIWILISLA